MSADDSFSNHKLCGFLCAVLTVTPGPSGSTPAFNDRCEVFGDGFRTQNGVVLAAVGSGEQCGESGGGASRAGRRMRKVGMVNGSMSVVHQLHALVSRNCLKSDARVVWVEEGEGKVATAVVLVDVYVPIEVWSGWQFPRSGPVAGAFFRHLRFTSCDIFYARACDILYFLSCVGEMSIDMILEEF